MYEWHDVRLPNLFVSSHELLRTTHSFFIFLVPSTPALLRVTSKQRLLPAYHCLPSRKQSAGSDEMRFLFTGLTVLTATLLANASPQRIKDGIQQVLNEETLTMTTWITHRVTMTQTRTKTVTEVVAIPAPTGTEDVGKDGQQIKGCDRTACARCRSHFGCRGDDAKW